MVKLVLAIICPCCSRVKKNQDWVYLSASDWLRIRAKYIIDKSHQLCPDCEKLKGGDI